MTSSEENNWLLFAMLHLDDKSNIAQAIGMFCPSKRYIPLLLVFIVTSMVSSEAAVSPIVAAESKSSTIPTKDSSTAPLDGDNATMTTKTIFLVRHAESEENRRIGSLKAAFKALTRFSLPKSKDIVAACELIRVDQQIDSNVSEFGQKQIQYMANVIQESNFMKKHEVQLLAHSPLIRAKETCRGMFGVAACDPSPTTTVFELQELTEMTPAEWIPGNSGSLHQRFRALEAWITSRPEDSMVLVGHSQFFKALLQLDYKFGNCDVIQVQFHSQKEREPKVAYTAQWTNVTPLHLCRIPPTAADVETTE